MDTRTFRSRLKPTFEKDLPGKERYIADFSPRKSMLGRAQWLWLEEKLQQRADIRILASSTQLLAIGHGYEKWGNFPLERNRLIDLLDSKGIAQTIIVSGDRHRAAIYQLQTPAGNQIIELTSSSLNMPIAWQETGTHRIGEMYARENFGVLDITTQQGRVQITGRIVGLSGDSVQSIAIRK